VKARKVGISNKKLSFSRRSMKRPIVKP